MSTEQPKTLMMADDLEAWAIRHKPSAARLVAFNAAEEMRGLYWRVVELEELLDAADNALNVLIACCVPAGRVDDRKAILEAQQMLRVAIAKAKGQA